MIGIMWFGPFNTLSTNGEGSWKAFQLSLKPTSIRISDMVTKNSSLMASSKEVVVTPVTNMCSIM